VLDDALVILDKSATDRKSIIHGFLAGHSGSLTYDTRE